MFNRNMEHAEIEGTAPAPLISGCCRPSSGQLYHRVMTERGHKLEISAIRRRLAELSAERDALEAHLKKLLRMAVSAPST